MKRIGVAVQTWNRLDILQTCFPTWRNIPGAVLAICDAGSDEETCDWLNEQDVDWLYFGQDLNPAECYNRMLAMYRFDHPEIEYILLGTPDFELLPGSVDAMVKLMDESPDAGFIGWAQANYAQFIPDDGYVREIGHECVLQRQAMWKEVGLYTESLGFYHCDSCQSTIANQFGWHTRLVDALLPNEAPGYVHHGRGEHSAEIVPLRAAHHQRWSEITDLFFQHWTAKIETERP